MKIRTDHLKTILQRVDTLTEGTVFTSHSSVDNVVMMRVWSQVEGIAAVYLTGKDAGSTWSDVPPQLLVRVRSFEMIEVC